MIAALGSAVEGKSRMFPVGDDNSQRRTFPTVTIVLIVLNVLVFLAELSRRRPVHHQLGLHPVAILRKTPAPMR